MTQPLEPVRRRMPGVFWSPLWSACLALALLFLAAPALARPDAPGPGEQWHYAPGDKVESFASPGGHFRIHFTRTGAHAVKPLDADANDVPDHVQDLADLYELVLAFYGQLGFQAPKDDGAVTGNNGGDARFDVYLLDFALKADGNYVHDQCNGDVCNGYMVQENDFAGYGYPSVSYANRVLASHEFFHAVQAAYDANQGGILSEGTAVWATEKFDSALSDLENFLPGYLDRPDRPLDKPMLGPVDAFSYGAALFFLFLDEHIGKNIIRDLWLDCVDGAQGLADPQWFGALDALLARLHATTFASEFLTFATWNLYTGTHADPKRSYAHGKGYPLVAMTEDEAPYVDDALRVYYASSQYVSVPPDGRDQMTAVVVSTFDLSTLRLSLVVRHGKVLSDPVAFALPLVGARPTIDTSDADEVIAMVVNTAMSGESVRGVLCIGSPDELDQRPECLPAPSAIAEGEPDAGSSAEVSAPDGGSVQADAIGAPATPVASGCAAGRSMPGGGGMAVLLISVLAGLHAVRRRLTEDEQP